ncbi:MAG TPA: alcohol dehydrogenase, partial [Bacteroidales bacterium]|nr:alcohol dehydrogenase [Bacteroidales bacterium]
MVGAVHAIGHACGAAAHVHHGTAMAILLPHVMKFNLEKLSGLYAEILLPLAGAEVYATTPAEKRAEKCIEVIIGMNTELNKLTGMPDKLSAAGVKPEMFNEIAQKAIDDGAMMPNPKDVEFNEVIAILKQAF